MQDSTRLVSAALLPGMIFVPLALATPGVAQVIPDGTLGNEGSVVTPLDANTDRIDGGALRDSLLFHSFEGFNIPDGQGVYFANPAFVNTIFSRVTGADPSLLFGTLGVLGDADLMFINPNGIVFGPNAELDLNGAFTATTATGVVFPGGEAFSALEPEAAPLLTVNVTAPVGVVFEGETPAAIVNQGNLVVEAGHRLTFIGEAVASIGHLSAPGGQIRIAAVNEIDQVFIDTSGQILLGPSASSFPSDREGSTGTLSLTNWVDASALNADNIPADIAPGTTVITGRLDTSDDQGTGGEIQVLGDNIGLFGASVTASGATGGGLIRVGGDYQGQGNLSNAQITYIDENTFLAADAIEAGQGGQIIVWSDVTTRILGAISTQGGGESGNGGFVETSSLGFLEIAQNPDISAPNGMGGIWGCELNKRGIRHQDLINPVMHHAMSLL